MPYIAGLASFDSLQCVCFAETLQEARLRVSVVYYLPEGSSLACTSACPFRLPWSFRLSSPYQPPRACQRLLLFRPSLVCRLPPACLLPLPCLFLFRPACLPPFVGCLPLTYRHLSAC